MRFLMIAVFGSLVLGGCAAQNDPRLQKVDKLEKDLATIAERVTAIDTKINGLGMQIEFLKVMAEPYKSAVFDPANPSGYSRIDTDGGTFLVSVKNVVPFVDGFRVTCNFGNPSSATYRGFKLKAKWGTRFNVKDPKMNYLSWQASLQEKELSLTEVLHSGSWNPVTFALSPAKAEEFGYLELSMETNTLTLAQR